MLFADKKINLAIESVNPKQTIFFKAFLEKSDLQVKFLDENLKYTPFGYINNTILTKTQYNVDFSFNVFAEDREQAILNYDDLHILLHMMKPNYNFAYSQYIPRPENLFGNIKIQFEGMPQLRKDGEKALPVYVTNFNYQINKDLGYILAPFVPRFVRQSATSDAITPEFKKFLQDNGNPEAGVSPTTERKALNNSRGVSENIIYYEPLGLKKDFDNAKDRLIPLGFKIDITGRVLLKVEDSVRVIDIKDDAPIQSTRDPSETIIERVFGRTSGVENPQSLDAIAALIAITKGEDFYQSKNLEQMLRETKAAIDSKLILSDGNAGTAVTGEADAATKSRKQKNYDNFISKIKKQAVNG